MAKNHITSRMISIIVPVYNADDTIVRCVDSVLAQTYDNWELLLVDDGSNDKSGYICDQYAVLDKRIKSFHKENGGVSSARNYGLKYSVGEWVVFIDSDDYVEPKYLQDFFSTHINLNKTSIVIQGMIRDAPRSSDYLKFNNAVFEGNDVVLGIIRNNLFTFGAPYCKLYNREILLNSKLMFPLDYSFGEDTIFFLRYMQYVDSLTIVSSCNYHYVEVNQDSLSRRSHAFKQLKAYFVDYLDVLSRLEMLGNQIYNLRKINSKSVGGIIKKILLDMFNLSYSSLERRKFYAELREVIWENSCYRESAIALFVLITPLHLWLFLIKIKSFLSNK